IADRFAVNDAFARFNPGGCLFGGADGAGVEPRDKKSKDAEEVEAMGGTEVAGVPVSKSPNSSSSSGAFSASKSASNSTFGSGLRAGFLGFSGLESFSHDGRCCQGSGVDVEKSRSTSLLV